MINNVFIQILFQDLDFFKEYSVKYKAKLFIGIYPENKRKTGHFCPVIQINILLTLSKQTDN